MQNKMDVLCHLVAFSCKPDLWARGSMFKASCFKAVVCLNCLHTACNSRYFPRAAALCTKCKDEKQYARNVKTKSSLGCSLDSLPASVCLSAVKTLFCPEQFLHNLLNWNCKLNFTPSLPPCVRPGMTDKVVLIWSPQQNHFHFETFRTLSFPRVYPEGAFVKTANLSDNKIMLIRLILLIMTRALWMPITV